MKTKRNTLIVMIVLVILLVTAAIVYNALSKEHTPEDAEASQESKDKAPDFTVYDSGGTPVSLSSFAGKPVVLNFWASWCPPCKAEMPDFEKLYQEYKDQDIVFLMVNLTNGYNGETLTAAKKFIKDSGYTFPVYYDTESEAADAYGISSIPDTFFIDKEGTIIKSYIGMVNEAKIRSNIEKLLEK